MKLRRKSKAMFMGSGNSNIDSQEQSADDKEQTSGDSANSVGSESSMGGASVSGAERMSEKKTHEPKKDDSYKSSMESAKDKQGKSAASAKEGDFERAVTAATTPSEPVASKPAAADSTVDHSSNTTSSYGEVPPIDPTADLSGYDEYKSRMNASDINERDSMIEFLSGDGEYGALPMPEVFNAYPPEVQRKIMEWTDRDVKARRDDESRRQDEMTRAMVERNRRNQVIPAIIIVLAVLCAAVTTIVTGNPLAALIFMIVPVVVIVARVVTTNDSGNDDKRSKPSR